MKKTKKILSGLIVFGLFFLSNGFVARADNWTWSQLPVRVPVQLPAQVPEQVQRGGEWIYTDGQTRAQGWRQIDGVWYYFEESGKESAGVMQVGWMQSDGKWYYLSEADGSLGAMQTGWKEIGGKWYYLEAGGSNRPLGSMYANEKTPDGYFVGADGVWSAFSSPYAAVVKNHAHGVTKAREADMNHLKYMEMMQDFDHGKAVYHDGYVEFKDVSITVYTLFDKATVEQYKVGERFQIESKWYKVLAKNTRWEAGKSYRQIDVAAENPTDESFDRFWFKEVEDGYLFYGFSDDIMSAKKIYTGSIYIKMDANVAYFDSGSKVVTLEEYLKMFGDDPFIYGYFNMEDDGMISDLYMIVAG